MCAEILFEGLYPDELLALTDEELSALVFEPDSIVVQIGSSRILGRFARERDRLVVELAHIDGGGEGVLPALGALIARFAKREKIASVEWLVHATRCAEPNPKLRSVLDRRGFVVEEVAGVGEVYRHVSFIGPPSVGSDVRADGVSPDRNRVHTIAGCSSSLPAHPQ